MSADIQGTPAKLGLRALFAASIGVIVAQLGMVTLMQGVGLAGWGFFVALVIAFVLALSNAMAYAEMALMLPHAGNLSGYTEAALGSFPAILLVFAGYVTPAIFGLPVELILSDQILRQTIPLEVPPFFWPVAAVLLFAGLNALGTDIFSKVQTALSFTLMAFLLLAGAWALWGVPATAVQGAGFAGLAADANVTGVIALAFWVFVGSEFVTPLVGEARNPRRDLPRAMLGGLVLIFLVQLLFALGAARLMPRQLLAESPTPHIDYAVAVFGAGARPLLALLAVLASASLLNSVLGAVPRMLQGMAENGQVFPLLKHCSRRFQTPVVAIAFVACLPLIGLFWSGGDPGAIIPLTVAASIAWILAYIVAQLSLLVLRRRHPDWPRPYRAPGAPWLPLAAIVGMVYVIAQSAPSPDMVGQIARYTGGVLALFALVGALWVKGVMKRGLFEPRAFDPREPQQPQQPQ